MSGHEPDGSGSPPRPLPPLRHPFLVLAAALGLVSLGLPWETAGWGASWPVPGQGLGGTDLSAAATVTGGAHPVRVIGLAAAVLLVTAVRQGRARLATVAIGVGALALPLGLDGGLSSGRVVYAAALLLAALACGMIPRPGSSRRSPAPRDDAR